jgi:TonB family protein
VVALLAETLLTASSVAPQAETDEQNDRYADEVSDAVFRSWAAAPPRRSFAGFAAAVKVSIARDGTLSPGTVLRSSGDEIYDRSCLAALAATARVPPPPAVDRRGVVLVLEFEGAPPGGAARVHRTFDLRPGSRPERMAERLLPPTWGGRRPRHHRLSAGPPATP